MPFMTAASLRNPNTLGSALSGLGEKMGQRKQEGQIATVAREVQEGIASLSQQEQADPTTLNNMVKGVFERNPGLSLQAQQMALKMAHDAQSRMMQSQGLQQKQTLFGQGQEDRARRLQRERGAGADVSLLGRLQNVQPGAGGGMVSPAGVEGVYSVPETEASLLGGLSYGGRKQFEADKVAKEQAAYDISQRPVSEQKAAADLGLTQARTKALGRKAAGRDKQFAPSTLKKLMVERQELLDQGLSLDHPDILAFDNKISGQDIDIVDMTPEEVDTWGAWVNLTGKMPSLGRGKQSTKVRMAIAKSAARQALGRELEGIPEGRPDQTPMDAALAMVGSQADTKSIQGSLNFLDKQLSSMGSFVTNLNSQVDKVGELAKDLETFDTRLLNIPLRALRGRIQGSPLQAKYDMYLSEIESEIGKLATGSTASVAELSATAQEKWSKIHDKNLSVGDMLDLLEETKNAANFRVNSVRNELNRSRRRMRSAGRKFEDSKIEPIDPVKTAKGMSDADILKGLGL